MNEGIVGLFIAPLILFIIFVAPIWLILHYKSKKQVAQGLAPEDQAVLKEMAVKAEVMAERIETLEAILDQETPEWRKKA